MKFTNPVIPGFHPDPSVCRVGGDYFLVTSSFEYFPGVPVFHSRDLAHWRPIGHCLTRKSQLPLDGVPSSGGIYAPTLRHHAGRFYMVTTLVTRHGEGRVSECANFYVHADDPAGEWSDPVPVAQGGIDPSLYFDDDGKTYFTSNSTAWAPVRGLYQCEIDIRTGRTLTDTALLWTGTGGAWPEAPHLLRRGGFYYLVAAEGGTERCHMVTVARSRTPEGPFESCPHNPILSHRSLPTVIQSTGHADFVEDPAGRWWAVFLGVRLANGNYHNLGRETYLAPVEWTGDGWPIVNGGKPVTPVMDVPGLLPAHPWPAEPARDDFDAGRLGLRWNFRRNPDARGASLSARPGWLRLRCSPIALDDVASPAFVGRRQQHFDVAASTLLDFEPREENEEAGLAVVMDEAHHCELAVTRRAGRRVALLRRRVGSLVGESAPVPLPEGPVVLRVTADREHYHFAIAPARPDAAAPTPQEWSELGRHELRYLSTEVAGGFTGVYLGPYASARGAGSDNAAFFDWFDYEPAPRPEDRA